MIIKKDDKAMQLFLSTILNKNIENINENDLKNIENLVFSGKTISGEKNNPDYNILNNFETIKSINIENDIINQEKLDIIAKHTDNIAIKNSAFEDDIDYKKLNSIKTFCLNGCYVEEYSKILQGLNNIKNLEIIYPYDEEEINIDDISDKVENLFLEGCILNNLNTISKFKQVKNLSLLNTSVIKMNFRLLNELSNLKKLYISQDYLSYDPIVELGKKVEVYSNHNEVIEEDIIKK